MKRVDLGFAILASFFKLGHVPNVTTYNPLIKGLVLKDKVVEAVDLFKKLIKEKLCEPNEITFSTLIDGLCKLGHTSKVVELLRVLEKSDCKPVVEAYSTVIDSLCKDRMVDDVINLLSKMIDKGISPDVVTYNSLIHGLCNFGRWNEVKQLLNEMVDHKISPDLRTFNILVDMFNNLASEGLHPNAKTYTIMINGLCQQGLLQDAKKLFEKMENSGCLPNEVTYNVIVQGFLKKQGISQDIMMYLKQMVKRGFLPNVSIFSILIDLFPAEGQDPIFQNMIQKLVPNDNRSPPVSGDDLFPDFSTKC